MSLLQRCKDSWNSLRHGPRQWEYHTAAGSESELGSPTTTSSSRLFDENVVLASETPQWSWIDTIAPLVFLISLTIHLVVKGRLDAACTSLAETWSPLTHLVEYEWRQFDFEACTPEFCGGYEETREKAWENFWDLGWYAFPRSHEDRLHHPPDHTDWLHLLEDENALISMPGVIHQIHCLSLVREAIHRDEFHNRGTTALEKARFNWHANHCIYILDVLIRCKADISPVVLEEVEQGGDGGAPAADGDGVLLSKFRLRDPVKRCRKYEPLRSWYSEHTVCSSFCNSAEIYDGAVSHSHG